MTRREPPHERPTDWIARRVRGWADRSDDEVLAALAAQPPLADETDPCWDEAYVRDTTCPFVALADVCAQRRIRAAVRPLLDRMAYGDPGEMMRGIRHSLEAIAAPDWAWLAGECLAAARSERRGTRLWALDELAMLVEPRARALFEEAAQSEDAWFRDVAEIGLARLG